MLARPFEGPAVPDLCYNLREAPRSDERNPDYATRLQAVLGKLGFPAYGVPGSRSDDSSPTKGNSSCDIVLSKQGGYRTSVTDRGTLPGTIFYLFSLKGWTACCGEMNFSVKTRKGAAR